MNWKRRLIVAVGAIAGGMLAGWIVSMIPSPARADYDDTQLVTPPSITCSVSRGPVYDHANVKRETGATASFWVTEAENYGNRLSCNPTTLATLGASWRAQVAAARIALSVKYPGIDYSRPIYMGPFSPTNVTGTGYFINHVCFDRAGVSYCDVPAMFIGIESQAEVPAGVGGSFVMSSEGGEFPTAALGDVALVPDSTGAHTFDLVVGAVDFGEGVLHLSLFLDAVAVTPRSCVGADALFGGPVCVAYQQGILTGNGAGLDYTTGTLPAGVTYNESYEQGVQLRYRTLTMAYVGSGSGGGTTYRFENSVAESGGTVTLTNDTATPERNAHYGTNDAGTRGWKNDLRPDFDYAPPIVGSDSIDVLPVQEGESGTGSQYINRFWYTANGHDFNDAMPRDYSYDLRSALVVFCDGVRTNIVKAGRNTLRDCGFNVGTDGMDVALIEWTDGGSTYRATVAVKTSDLLSGRDCAGVMTTLSSLMPAGATCVATKASDISGNPPVWNGLPAFSPAVTGAARNVDGATDPGLWAESTVTAKRVTLKGEAEADKGTYFGVDQNGDAGFIPPVTLATKNTSFRVDTGSAVYVLSHSNAGAQVARLPASPEGVWDFKDAGDVGAGTWSIIHDSGHIDGAGSNTPIPLAPYESIRIACTPAWCWIVNRYTPPE